MAQATATALNFDNKITLYGAKTRKSALQSIVSGEAVTAKHEHAVDPLVHSAANHFIQNHRALDLELHGFPYEVLEQASSQLKEAGISSKMMTQAINALEEYIINMGADFSREAKAKPLYARFKVTDHEPDDLRPCEQTQATFLDGTKSYGGDSARIIRYLSLFGSKSTSSQGVDMDTMFASKNMGLFVFFGSPSNEGVGGFDSIDSALMNAMQGLGGALSDEAMAELKEMIAAGNISPEVSKLLQNLAELAQLQEAMLTPDAVENAEAKLSELTKEISEQIVQVIENGTLPQGIILAVIDTLAENGQSSETAQSLLAENDNSNLTAEVETLIEQLTELLNTEGLDQGTIDTLTSQIDVLNTALTDESVDLTAALSDVKVELSDLASQEGLPDAIYDQVSEILLTVSALSQTVSAPPSLAEKLMELSELGAEGLLELIQELAQTDNLPPELQELLDQIDIDNLTPESLAEALSAKTDSDLTQSIQTLILALDNPEMQSLLPQETLNHLNQFLDSHSDLVTAVSTHVVIQNFESALEAMDPASPEAQDLQKIVEGLKSGEDNLSAIDTTVLQAAALQLSGEDFSAIEATITTIEASTADNVILSNDTIDALSEVAKNPDLSDDARAKIEASLESGDDTIILAILAEDPTILDALPTDSQTDIASVIEQDTIDPSGDTPPPTAEIIDIKTGEEILMGADHDTPLPPTAPPVSLEPATIDNLQAMVLTTSIAPEAKDAINAYLANPTNDNLQRVQQTLGDNTPPEVVRAFSEPAPIIALASELSAIAQTVTPPTGSNPIPSVQKAPIEALKSAAKMLDKLSGDEMISPAQAELLLRKMNDGNSIIKDPVLKQQINQIRKQIIERTIGGEDSIPKDVLTGPCKGCVGGDCANCGPQFPPPPKNDTGKTNDRTASNSMSDVNNILDKSTLNIIVNDLRSSTDINPSALDKKPIEALNSAITMLDNIEAGGDHLISPERVEILLRKIDEGMLAVKDPVQFAQIGQLREDILSRTEGGPEKIPKEVREGGCPGCAGGDCANCGPQFLLPSKEETGINNKATNSSSPRATKS